MRAAFDFGLQPLHLQFKLLIAVLQLLDRAGQIADGFLHAIDAGHDIARRILGTRALRAKHTRESDRKEMS
jgi:hypothetical protein